jgi:hypothetical protein
MSLGESLGLSGASATNPDLSYAHNAGQLDDDEFAEADERHAARRRATPGGNGSGAVRLAR